MEWTDKLKREVSGRPTHGPGWLILVVIVILVILFLLCDMGSANEVHADDDMGVVRYRDSLLEAEQSQAKSLRSIADELHRIRISMERR